MTIPCWIRLFALTISASFFVFQGTAQDDETAKARFFKEAVHPVLEARCFKCHGGERKLKGGFRVTSRKGLLRGGDLGAGYDSEIPVKSLILTMLSYDDDKHQMPPKAKLPKEEITILKKWIEAGAVYDPALEIKGAAGEGLQKGFTISEEDRNWWAYRPLSHEAPPKVSDPAWAKNPIDAFIFTELKKEGLNPNQPASSGMLIRRLTYDLIGLPPTPKDVSDFEIASAKNADAAYEALIDDLLARPQYGEKWARHWLDIVRYAESNGFERDNSKPEIWRYRDYVIKAFNEDKPYDRFVMEQLAGDEIATPTQDSLTATGYHRLMQWDDEPADRKQHIYDVLADNVLVTSEAFLGTTMGCSRCHDHKADPISQKDYYSFMSFFHGVTPYKTEGTIRPWADAREMASFESKREKRISKQRSVVEIAEQEMTAYLKQNGKLRSRGSAKVVAKTFVENARKSPATWSMVTTPPAAGWKEVASKALKNWTKAKGGFGTSGTPNAKVTTEWKTSDIWLRTDFGAKEIPERLVLDLYHDESVEVYLNGVEIYRAKGHVTNYEEIELGKEALAAFQTGKNVLAAHCNQTKGGQFIDIALRTAPDKPGSLSEALSSGGKKLEKELGRKLGRDIVKEWRSAKAAILSIAKEHPGTPLNVVTESGPKAQPLHVHLRGSAHAPGDEVVPGFPSVFGKSNEATPAAFVPVALSTGSQSSGRRLALAKWIASSENPLTGRVIMNRLWQHHFGRGIVRSTNDFGKLGEDPTHPELLDFLAAELVKRDWSLKQMHRLILKSRTYRMSSAPNEVNFAKDPSNDFFWRFNMRRLTAEELRDSMLMLSGKLNLKDSGGAWVYPSLPKEVLATASHPGRGWPISKNEKDHYRRSVYIHVKRSLRFQMLADFDQADTDSPCAVRFSTTVPTQSLAMLNSKFVNDQASLFAGRLRAGSKSSVATQVKRGLELAFQRQPKEDEIAHCVELIETLKTEKGLSEEAALERFALIALNLNEFVYVD